MPVHPSGNKLLIGYDTYMMAKRVNYDVGENLSPENIIGYYKEKLQKLGFNENNQSTFYNKQIADKEFIPDGNWKKPPTAIHKGWLNSKENTIIKLSIYHSSQAEIHVGILMHPYVNPDLQYEFQKYLENSGKENEFFELFSKYPGPGNTLDVQKALKGEPNNKVLKEFALFDKRSREEMKVNYIEFNK